MPLRSRWPLLAVAASIASLFAATLLYPGGTLDAPTTIGFSWTDNFFSALFQPTALNGARNPARFAAIPAMLVLCLTLGIVFWQIARCTPDRRLAKIIEIGGIGTVVYVSLAVTPMHDLALTIGLLFSFATFVTIIHLLFSTGRRWLGVWGLACFGLSVISATLFFRHQYNALLAAIQKINLLVGPTWILAIYYNLPSQPVRGQPSGDLGGGHHAGGSVAAAPVKYAEQGAAPDRRGM